MSSIRNVHKYVSVSLQLKTTGSVLKIESSPYISRTDVLFVHSLHNGSVSSSHVE
jgi:hypothetical protein